MENYDFLYFIFFEIISLYFHCKYFWPLIQISSLLYEIFPSSSILLTWQYPIRLLSHVSTLFCCRVLHSKDLFFEKEREREGLEERYKMNTKSRATITLHDVSVLSPGVTHVDPLYVLAEQIRLKKEEIERNSAELKALEQKMKTRKTYANVTYTQV